VGRRFFVCARGGWYGRGWRSEHEPQHQNQLDPRPRRLGRVARGGPRGMRRW
jgi:hypothetical protein